MNHQFSHYRAPQKRKTTPTRSIGTVLSCAVIALLVHLSFGTGKLAAQAGNCTSQSSFQFPLWSDGTKWNLSGLYNTIQLADIDGDGQDELLGYGPFGVEVWHWEPNGESWTPLPGATPAFLPSDSLMAADVNGDGQAEIIQITPNINTQTNPLINVWHYDAVPQVWRLQAPLALTLSRSTANTNNGYNFGTVAPIIQFADMNTSGRKELIYFQTFGAAGGNAFGTYANPLVYQVKADGSGWALIGTGPTLQLPVYPANTPFISAKFAVGDVRWRWFSRCCFPTTQGFVVYQQQVESRVRARSTFCKEPM